MDRVIEKALEIAIRKNDNIEEPVRYLEIGVHVGTTFKNVPDKILDRQIIKEGVDPYGLYDDVHRMTSQVFFALNDYFWKKKYDVIFIDAFHFSPILNQEINESLKCLKKGGIIVLHDTIPRKESSGTVSAESIVGFQKAVSYPLVKNYEPSEAYRYSTDFPGYPEANGDCWRSVVNIRMTQPNLKVCSFNECQSMESTILMRGKHPIGLLENIEQDDIDWSFFTANKNQILNIIEFKDFEKFAFLEEK